MKEALSQLGGVTFPKGFLASGVACGIKSSGKPDLAIVYSREPATSAAMFTANIVRAASVIYSQSLVNASGVCRAVVINSGNANACTGAVGLDNARSMGEQTAGALGLPVDQCLVASTGVIGERLPMDKVTAGIERSAERLSETGGQEAAQAILTTDAFAKEVAAELRVGDAVVRIGAMAKGAGMIAPRLVLHATMIAIITTDASATLPFLRRTLKEAVDVSFNACSVDGDTSTNDSVFLLANGMSGCPTLGDNTDLEGEREFAEKLTAVCVELAKMIVRDGEGADKLITYHVEGALSDREAMAVAAAMANSLLVKTAFHGEDANWGRLVAAAGYSGASVDYGKVRLSVGGLDLVRAGEPLVVEAASLRQVMERPEIEVRLELGLGPGMATFYGCDLSHEYVRINSEYHT